MAVGTLERQKKRFKKKVIFSLVALHVTPPPLLMARPLREELVFCGFPKWFLYYTILNQNASQINQTDWSDFVFLNSKVSNLKSLSKTCSTNIHSRLLKAR